MRSKREHLKTMFSLFDEDKTGAISKQNISQVASDLQMQLTSENIRWLIVYNSSNADKIFFNEFMYIMT